MPAPSFTNDEFLAAVAALQQRQIRPTIRTVQSELGGRGSPQRINALLRSWRERQGEDSLTPRAPPDAVTARLATVAPALWESALSEARAAVAHELATLRSELAGERQAGAENQALLEERDRALTIERQEREAVVARLDSLHGDLGGLRTEHGRLSDSMSRHSDAVADLRSVITGTAEASRTLLLDSEERARAERTALLDRNQRLQASITDLAAQHATAVAERDHARAQAQEQAHAADARIAALVAEVTSLRAEVAAGTKDVLAAREVLAAEQAAHVATRTSLSEVKAALAAEVERNHLLRLRIEKLGSDLSACTARNEALQDERERVQAELEVVRDQLVASVRQALTDHEIEKDIIANRLAEIAKGLAAVPWRPRLGPDAQTPPPAAPPAADAPGDPT